MRMLDTDELKTWDTVTDIRYQNRADVELEAPSRDASFMLT
jgi:hypothetical protein